MNNLVRNIKRAAYRDYCLLYRTQQSEQTSRIFFQTFAKAVQRARTLDESTCIIQCRDIRNRCRWSTPTLHGGQDFSAPNKILCIIASLFKPNTPSL